MKLLSDEKHDLTEISLNDYSYQLNLTVRRLSRDDFGSYTCSAENLLGKAEGTIRLQGKSRFRLLRFVRITVLDLFTLENP